MDYCRVTAIFPPTGLDHVEAELMRLHVESLIVSRAHGFGLYRDFSAKDIMVDSTIAVTPVANVIHIRRFSGESN